MAAECISTEITQQNYHGLIANQLTKPQTVLCCRRQLTVDALVTNTYIRSTLLTKGSRSNEPHSKTVGLVTSTRWFEYQEGERSQKQTLW